MNRALVFAATLGACVGQPQTATIELSRRVLIGSVGDSIDLSPEQVALSGNGSIAAKRLESPHLIAIYDSLGTYVRTIGRVGGGPGEFESVMAFGFGPGDSVWVIDYRRIAQVFTPEGRFVRTVRFDGPVAGRITSDGLLSQSHIFMSSYVSPRLYSWEGKELARFRTRDSGGPADAKFGVSALVSRDRIWYATEDRYSAELLGSDGAVHRRITRTADWFVEGEKMKGMPWQYRPPARVHSMTFEADSLLWVLVRRAHRDWGKNTKPAPSENQLPTPRALSAINVDALFEGVIEVFDIQSGRLLASRDVAGSMLGFVTRGVMYELQKGDAGDVKIQLWNVTLRR